MAAAHKRPRITKAVREGWNEIRAFITCELEAAQAHQFECRQKEGDEDNCPCEGCTAARHAWAAIAWIDQRL